jgi:FkbM family methyltransferase
MKARFLYRAFKARYRDQGQEIEAAISALAEGGVAVDVGANKGAYLYWLRRAVGPTGTVFAYEPQQHLALYLRSVCARMEWQNVLVRDYALSDSAGARTLHVPGQGDSPGASLEEAILATTECRGERCETDTLDHQLADEGPVSLLKVDVEGHELQVFRGAARTLARHAPMLLFECEARHLTTHSMQDVFELLRGLGYSGSFFSPQGLLPIGRFDPSVHQRRTGGRFWDAPDYCNNFLFRRESEHPSGTETAVDGVETALELLGR